MGYKQWYELFNANPKELSKEEIERLQRCRQIPKVAFGVLLERADELRTSIMALEHERDIILDFLNGEPLEKANQMGGAEHLA